MKPHDNQASLLPRIIYIDWSTMLIFSFFSLI
uniref:Uncharacterized protein n=1 Tax=Lepeophtheirus salmonis TaxID=72036 RepID=A0A0K2T6R3_LEPSM